MQIINSSSKAAAKSSLAYSIFFTLLLFISPLQANQIFASKVSQVPENPIATNTPVGFNLQLNHSGDQIVQGYVRIYVNGKKVQANSGGFSSSNCVVFSLNTEWFDCGTFTLNGILSPSFTWDNPPLGNHTIRFETGCWLYNVDTDGDGWWDVCEQNLSSPVDFNVLVGASQITFSQPEYIASESGGSIAITVQRLASSTGDVSAEYTTNDGSAINDEDYSSIAGTLIWLNGDQTNKTINVPIIDNNLIEATESFTVSLSGLTGNALFGEEIATVNITDDDLPLLNLTASNAQANEEGTIAGSCAISVNNDPQRLQPINLQLQISGNAQSGSDYQPISSSLSIPSGVQNHAIDIVPVDDSEVEDQENIVVTITADSTFELANNRCEVFITSNDSPTEAPSLPVVSISLLDGIATEQDSKAAKVSISLDQPAGDNGLNISLNFSGDATAGEDASADYQLINNTVTIPAGSQNLTLDIVPFDDDEKENDETIIINLVAQANVYAIGEVTGVEIIIQDNEAEVTDTQNIIVQSLTGDNVQDAGLNEDIELVIEVKDDAGNPLQGAEISWSIQSDSTNSTTLQFESAETQTNEKGQAKAIFHSASNPQIYTLQANVKIENNSGELLEVTQTFIFEAGLAESITPDTPENAVAKSMDNFCGDLESSSTTLTDNQSKLLQRCADLAEASAAGNDAEVQQAMKAIAPEEVSSQGEISSDIAIQQLSNIGQRLTALRRGIKGVSFSGLSFQLKDENLPGSLLDYLFFDEGDQSNNSSLPGSLLDDRLGIFIIGSLSAGQRDPTKNENGFEFDTRGITLGADYRYTDELVLGTALGLANTDLTIDNQGGGLDSKGSSLSVFGMLYTSDRSYVNAVFNFGENRLDMTRGIHYKVGNNQRDLNAKGETKSYNKSFSLGGGYQFVQKKIGFTTELLARVDYLTSNINAYTEHGAEEFNLNIDEQKVQSLFFVIGGQSFMALSYSWGVLLPTVGFTWEHENETAHNISGTFVNDPTAADFKFSSDEEDDNYFRLSAGFSAVLKHGVSLFFLYDTVINKDFYSEENYSLGGRFERRF